MIITLKDIIKKYPTNINTDKMEDGLINKILFSDEEGVIPIVKCKAEPVFTIEDVTLDDIKEPEIEKFSETFEKYVYKFKGYELTIRINHLDPTRIFVDMSHPASEDVPLDYFQWYWDYRGIQYIQL